MAHETKKDTIAEAMERAEELGDASFVMRSGKDAEANITEMVAKLDKVAQAEPNTVSGRAAAALRDMMPGFVRTMDRERAGMVKSAKRDERGELYTDEDGVNEHLFVMTGPIINMIGSVVMTLVPCQGTQGVCPKCQMIRQDILNNLLSNVIAGTSGSLRRAVVGGSIEVSAKDAPLTEAALKKGLH